MTIKSTLGAGVGVEEGEKTVASFLLTTINSGAHPLGTFETKKAAQSYS